MANKIAIIVTTMYRDELLAQSIDSMLKYRPKDSVILIGDQGPLDAVKLNKYLDLNCHYYVLPHDCGLSYARNYLVKMAHEMGCDYCVIASDSMMFNEKTVNIGDLISHMDTYDCIGCHLHGGVPIYWVGWLKLLPHEAFEITFIDRNKPDEFFPCSIIHNFFIAKTASLLNVKWDEDLKLAEHEDFFYRYGQAGYKVAWTPTISCDYVKSRVGQQANLRDKNWKEGLLKLYNKYQMASWIRYVNRELGFFGVVK